MFWWIADRATLFYLLFGMLLCGLLVCWWQSRRGVYLASAGAVAALIALLFLLTITVVTDRQQLELNIRDMAKAVLDGDPEPVFRRLTQDVTIGGHPRDHFIRYADATIRKRFITYIHLWDFDVEELSRADRKARLAFRVRAESRMGDILVLCRAHFVLIGNDWMLQNLQVYNGVANTNQPLTIPLP